MSRQDVMERIRKKIKAEKMAQGKQSVNETRMTTYPLKGSSNEYYPTVTYQHLKKRNINFEDNWINYKTRKKIQETLKNFYIYMVRLRLSLLVVIKASRYIMLNLFVLAVKTVRVF